MSNPQDEREAFEPMLKQIRHDELIAELEWCLKNGTMGHRTYTALAEARAALATQQAVQGDAVEECCVNWAAGTSCFSDPKQNCPRLFPYPRPMETAPKNGTMLRLLVQFNEHSFDDSNDPCWVCGFNLGNNTGEDKWQFPGWSWVHDYILEASDDGTPIGWLPMLDATPPATGQVERDREDAERWRAFIGLEYKVRMEWACNLSLAPVLIEWVDRLRAARSSEGGDHG